MKTIAGAVALLGVIPCCAGDPFRNLSFDDIDPANLPGLNAEFGGISNNVLLMPGWTFPSVTPVTYNIPSSGAYFPEIYDNKSSRLPHLPLVGQYALAMFPYQQPEWFEQHGDIPVGTESLQFVFQGGSFMRVTVDGNELSVHFLGEGDSGDPLLPKYPHWGADVSAYAGKTATLRFTFQSGPVPPEQPQVLDDIQFSPIAIVPEPPGWTLLLAGGIVFGVMRRKLSSE